ncbi:alcohol dehydrogenase catalytic domain-containing protein [Streptomyces cellostaticus]|uniref:alcohol dehydrogenase catalytic domain-containing protein n=1 Tax=Streptomyces cellostaticus TaxID=67285 RepID=UPI00202629EF|nr:alcohol dehydrogenase catalytic domain-containing protein [Streptomyces cellostaticus]
MPAPGPGDALVRVLASGVCTMDVRQARGEMGYPRLVPGHEFVGEVVSLGPGVNGLGPGDRVGVTWHQRWCRTCDHCVRGRLELCKDADETGIHIDGGHAEYALVDAASTVPIPRGLAPEAAAVLLCSGYAAYSALMDVAAGPGTSLAVIGIGGIGHLAVQYARAMGVDRIVAVTESAEKERLAKELGADEVIVSGGGDFSPALKSSGLVDAAVLTSEADGALAAAVEGLAPYGRLSVLPATVAPVPLVLQRLLHFKLTIRGSSQGPRHRLAEMLRLHERHDLTALVESYPLDKATDVLERVARREAHLRTVLVP